MRPFVGSGNSNHVATPSWGRSRLPRALICRIALRQPASASASAHVVSALAAATSGSARASIRCLTTPSSAVVNPQPRLCSHQECRPARPASAASGSFAPGQPVSGPSCSSAASPYGRTYAHCAMRYTSSSLTADVLTPRMVHMIEDLAVDLHHLDTRIDSVTGEIETVARDGEVCPRLMTVPRIGHSGSRKREPFGGR
jgi:hypothetical protein